jgi:hypothetical protein
MVLLGAGGGIWVVFQEVLKTRANRRTQQSADTRADRTDVVGISEKNAEFWRQQYVIERARADALQQELFEARIQNDHTADLASATMLQLALERQQKEAVET